MKRKRKRINEVAEIVTDILVDAAADKVADNIVDDDTEEEDAETVSTVTPTGNNGTAPVGATSLTQNEEEKDEPDPMIEYILQQMQQNKDKQMQDAQADYLYRQQQAEKIVKDIEDYIKQNTGK